jgi:hypothetical protein
MSGGALRLFTDEDVDPKLAPLLRERGYDATSCHEVGRNNRRIPDHEQLLYATLQGRAILSFNARDYVPLDRRWQASGREHAGIILSTQTNDVGELLRRVESHLRTCDPAIQRNCLLWLP